MSPRTRSFRFSRMLAIPLGLVLATGPANAGEILEAPPAPVRLRTAALLLSDQQGGELSMVGSVVRRPASTGEGLDTLVTVELDDNSLRQALPEGGTIEGHIYLVDARLEVHDSVSAIWQLPAPELAEAGEVSDSEPEDVTQEQASAETDANAEALKSEAPKAEAPEATGLDPVRFTTTMPAPPSGDYVFRILFRAGEHFGLRSLPLTIPVEEDVVPTLMEPVLGDAVTTQSPWSMVSPAGRGVGRPAALPALVILRRGSRVPVSFPLGCRRCRRCARGAGKRRRTPELGRGADPTVGRWHVRGRFRFRRISTKGGIEHVWPPTTPVPPWPRMC